jgi:hypothetical protein
MTTYDSGRCFRTTKLFSFGLLDGTARTSASLSPASAGCGAQPIRDGIHATAFTTNSGEGIFTSSDGLSVDHHPNRNWH